MTGLSGDMGALSRLAERMHELASAASQRALMERLATRAQELVQQGFEEEADPHHTPWKPSRRVLAHGGKTLTLSGRLKRGFRVHVFSHGFEIINRVPYAAAHNYGARIEHGARTQAMAWSKSGKLHRNNRHAFRARKITIGEHVTTLPARPMIPDGHLPGSWAEAFKEETVAHVRTVLER